MSVYQKIYNLLGYDEARPQGVHFWFAEWLTAKAAGDVTPDVLSNPYQEFKRRCAADGLLQQPDFLAVYVNAIGAKGE